MDHKFPNTIWFVRTPVCSVDATGDDARAYLQNLLSNDIAKLKTQGKALYSCMLNDNGGVVDDLIVYFIHDSFYRVIINSATRDKDIAWLNRQASAYPNLSLRERDDVAMIAVQGPAARERALTIFADEQRAPVESLGRFPNTIWFVRTPVCSMFPT